MTDKYQKLRQDLAAAIADAKQQGGVNERAEQIAALLAEFDALTAAQPDLTQQTLDDVMAGIPARDAEIEALRKEIETLRAAQAQQPVSGADRLPIELCGISEAIGDGGGFWRSCSGCHELNEGMATGPFSETFKCHLGVGCSECGGIGAIWDTTDYDAMADFMAAEYQQRTENTEPVGQDQLRDAAQMIEPSGNSGELHASFESWRKSELPWTSPATPGIGFAWDAWRARAALAQQDADKVDAEPDMYWDDDDPERCQDSIHNVLVEVQCNRDLSVGDVVEVQQAIRLPNASVRIIAVENEDGSSDLEYEVIDAARKEQA